MATHSKQKKVKGGRQKLKLFRSNEPLKSVLMWGISYSIAQMNHVKPRAVLLNDDFKASIKVKVHNQFFNKENMPSRYKFKEYCPMVFQNLRKRFDINTLDYLNAFTKKQPPWSQDKRYFVTYDNKFVVELINSEDVEHVHHFLQSYHEYIVNTHGKTLLPRCLAMYRLIVSDQIYYMLVSKNTFSPRLSISKKYQLKGCTVDREASNKEKAKPQPVYKDLDFTNDGCKIEIGPEEKARVMNLLQNDIEFLQSHNMMSYSLLVGIHDPDMVDKVDKTPSDEECAFSPGEDDDIINGANDDVLDSGGHDSNLTSDSETPGVVHSGIKQGGDNIGLSPPDSPGLDSNTYPLFSGPLDPDMELFGIKSSKKENTIFFLGVVNIFTKYDMKKRTAQKYKSVRLGHHAEISSVKPDLYAKRFLEFVNLAIE